MKIEKTIGIDGMHCAACSARVEKTLCQLSGVESAHVNLALEEASLVYEDRLLNDSIIKETIAKLGFSQREDIHLDDEDLIAKVRHARKMMVIAWVLTIFVSAIMIPHMLMGKMFFGHNGDSFVMFLLSLGAMLYPGRSVYASAFKSLKSGSANMDVLIALGTIASMLTFPLSFIVSGIPAHAFTGIAAMILAFHLTGRFLESSAKGKASAAIRKLINLGAKSALLFKDGAEVEIPIRKLQKGDIFVVKPGMKVPTDGIVCEGISSLDESMATGESLPVVRKTGDPVLGATLNLDGVFKAKATKVGNETFIAQIIKLVQEAQHSKVPIQVLADRVTAVFVPIILLLSFATFILWMLLPDHMQAISHWYMRFISLTIPAEGLAAALMASIAVLVIACPCALGLATPTALMVGSGIGANRGILIRNAEALQRMKDIRTIVFDKTGTLTTGKPELIQTVGLGLAKERVLALAAGLEAGSLHPIAIAINNAAKADQLDSAEMKDFHSLSGYGVSGDIGGKKYYLGNKAFVLRQNVHFPESLLNLQEQGLHYASVVYLFDDQDILGVLWVADRIKEESATVITKLKAMGIKTIMLSGDNPIVAEYIAKQCGIDTFLANVLPQEKAGEILKLKSGNEAVAMVGDGINDAPALKTADIGIAMGMGTDIAIEAADITIVRSDLNSLITAINLSNQTFRKIKQNLFWAFFYNLVAIPLAVFGVLHPVLAEAAMAFSSVSVVTNANLLKRKKI